ncbi:MAG: glutathione S-transferase N-terminal domain-containing protein [Candidatus Kaiserbacteria bacterium]|nr:glutathione S-transferase N-terminal domain-containing protein [Candidatus Kaiserbacteria bacterium]
MSDLILYEKTGCPWCIKVLNFASEKGIQFELRNIADAGVAEELIARGGKRQVPYLVDLKNGTEMYESADIVEYLSKRTN